MRFCFVFFLSLLWAALPARAENPIKTRFAVDLPLLLSVIFLYANSSVSVAFFLRSYRVFWAHVHVNVVRARAIEIKI